MSKRRKFKQVRLTSIKFNLDILRDDGFGGIVLIDDAAKAASELGIDITKPYRIIKPVNSFDIIVQQ